METSKLYVGNLNFKAEKEDLFDLFGNYGEIVGVNVIERDGLKKGFAFVEFSSPDAAKSAKEELDGKEFMSRTLRVDFATPREPRPRRDRY